MRLISRVYSCKGEDLIEKLYLISIETEQRDVIPSRGTLFEYGSDEMIP